MWDFQNVFKGAWYYYWYFWPTGKGIACEDPLIHCCLGPILLYNLGPLPMKVSKILMPVGGLCCTGNWIVVSYMQGLWLLVSLTICLRFDIFKYISLVFHYNNNLSKLVQLQFSALIVVSILHGNDWELLLLFFIIIRIKSLVAIILRIHFSLHVELALLTL